MRKKEMHGMHKTSEYKTWQNIKARCYNKKRKGYKNYGQKGITVCERWEKSFVAFLKDMGYKPFSEAQIDRIDNDGNYEPDNCHWVTAAENSRNKASTRLSIEKARDIRFQYSLGNITMHKLASIYNVGYTTINCIINNLQWKEITKENIQVRW